MNFHLLGGVTADEAEAVQQVYGHRWKTCAKCPKECTAVMLMRRQGGRFGDVDGLSLCDVHEAELLELFIGGPSYRLVSVEARPTPEGAS